MGVHVAIVNTYRNCPIKSTYVYIVCIDYSKR